MNNTTRTPDEPDGPVVAEQHSDPSPQESLRPAAESASAHAAPARAPSSADAAPLADAAPSTDVASSSGAAPSASGPGGSANGVAPVATNPAGYPAAPEAGGSTSGAQADAPTPQGGPATSSTGGFAVRRPTAEMPRTTQTGPAVASAEGSPEEQTAQMRLPTGGNGTGPSGAQTTQPVAQHSTAPAAVPMPGPAADAPPPWKRVPGQEPAAVLVENRPTEIDEDSEGPTAFLEPRSAPPQDERKAGRTSGVAGPARSGRPRPPRRAALQLKRLDPWSVLKLALVLAVVLCLDWLVAVGVLYGVLDGLGVWDRLNGTYADLVSGEAPSGTPLISAGRVFGIAAVVGAINSLLFAVAVTVGAFVYNVSADLVGGIEVTLSERD